MGYIRATYSKYFQSSISEDAVWSVAQESPTWCYVLGILHTFNLYNTPLYLKSHQSFFIKKSSLISFEIYMFWKIYFFEIWIWRKNKFRLMLKVNLLFLVQPVFFTFGSNLCKNKLLVLPVVILYKNWWKIVILRGHIFIFLQVILKLPFKFITHLK